MITVRTKTLLNIRRAPNTNDLPVGLLQSGFSFNVVEKISNGESVKGISDWYRDGAGKWYWGGGLEVIPAPVIHEDVGAAIPLIDYNTLFQNIPDDWKATRGASVKVGVIDTGVYQNHPDLVEAFNSNHRIMMDFTSSPDGTDDVSAEGHGTHICGLIGARSKDAIGIHGVASLCDLNILKASNDGIMRGKVLQALNWVNEHSNEFDILNLSFNVAWNIYHEMIPTLDALSAKGIVMIAAAGNNSDLSTNVFLPAFHSSMISVGAFDNSALPSLKGTVLDRVDFMLPLAEIMSTSNKGSNTFFRKLKGCSQACAFVSGMIALLISRERKKNPQAKVGRQFIIDQLRNVALDINSLNTLDNNFLLIKH